MHIAQANGIHLHFRDSGGAGRAVVFAHALGTDLRLWDKVWPLMPKGLRLIAYDIRGHGLSDCPAPPYAMGALVRDAEALLEAQAVRDCMFVGCSLGGMVAQGLAIKRPDLVGAAVLSNTAARIGTKEAWRERIETVRMHGVAALADTVLERWFTPSFRATPELKGWRNMLIRSPVDGYAGCAAAVGGTDFLTPVSTLEMAVLGIAGDHDGSTPPDLVRETVESIAGAEFQLIRGAGHLPMVEKPQEYAALLRAFLDRIERG